MKYEIILDMITPPKGNTFQGPMQDDVAAGGDHITAEAHVQPRGGACDIFRNAAIPDPPGPPTFQQDFRKTQAPQPGPPTFQQTSGKLRHHSPAGHLVSSSKCRRLSLRSCPCEMRSLTSARLSRIPSSEQTSPAAMSSACCEAVPLDQGMSRPSCRRLGPL